MVKRSRQDSISSADDVIAPEIDIAAVPKGSPALREDELGRHLGKYTHLDERDSDWEGDSVMRCSLAPHPEPLSFPSYEAYEVHYIKAHVNRCSQCRKNFPTDHFLELHIEENHDPLNQVLRGRGEKTYRCMVEDCDRVCSTPDKRRRHLIDKHMFPKEYDFRIVNDGIDKRSSMLRPRRHRRRSSAAAQIGRADGPLRKLSTARVEQPAPSSSIVDERRTDQSNDVAERLNPEHETNSREAVITRGDPHQPPPGASSGTSSERNEDSNLAELTKSMSSLKFVPPSIRLGKAKQGI